MVLLTGPSTGGPVTLTCLSRSFPSLVPCVTRKPLLGVALESASFVRFHVTGDTMPRYVPLCFLISISSSRPSSRGLVPSTNAAFPRSVRISSAIVKPGDVRPVSSIGDLLNPAIKIVLGRGDRSFVIIATNKSRQLRNLGLERGPGFLWGLFVREALVSVKKVFLPWDRRLFRD